jgi:hypothetical protein
MIATQLISAVPLSIHLYFNFNIKIDHLCDLFIIHVSTNRNIYTSINYVFIKPIRTLLHNYAK